MSSIDEMLQTQSEELTTCSICTEKFSFTDVNRTPKMLPCMHTFCLTCINHHHISVNEQRIAATSSFPCPTCRKTCYIPLGGIDRFPTDHKVGQIIDLMKLVNGSNSRPQSKGYESHCIVCSFQGEHAKAKNFCIECKKLLCDKCSKLHLETSIFRDHKLYEIEFDQKIKHIESKPSMCRVHENPFQYCCETCNRENLCPVCVMMPNHAGHEIRSITSSDSVNDNNVVNDSKLLASILDKKWRDIGENIDKLSKIKEEQLKGFSDTEIAIKKSSEDAIKMIKDEQSKFLKEMKLKRDKVNQDINELEKRNLEMQCNLKKVIHELNKNKEKNLSHLRVKSNELLQIDINIDSGLLYFMSFESKPKIELGEMVSKSNDDLDSVNPPIGRRVSWYSSQRLRRNSKTPPSSPSFESSPRDEYINSSVDGIRKDALILNLIKKWVTKKPAIFKHKETLSSSSSNSKFYEREQCDDSSSNRILWRDESYNDCRDCCFIDNRLVITDYYITYTPHVLKVFDAFSGAKCNFEGLDIKTNEYKISSIFYNPQIKIVFLNIDSNLSIKSFKVDHKKKDVLCLKSPNSIKLPNYIKQCCSIACIGDDLIIAAIGNNRPGGICTYSMRLQKFTNWIVDIEKPSYLAVNSERRQIIYSDITNHDVKVVGMDGGMQLRFNISVQASDMMPGGLDSDLFGNMFVADEGTRCVTLFNHDGNLVDNLFELSAKPRAIKYLDQLKIVAIINEKGVVLYKI